MSFPGDWPGKPSMQTYAAVGLARKLEAPINLTTRQPKTGVVTEWGDCTIGDIKESSFHFKGADGKSHRMRYEHVSAWRIRVDIEGSNPDGRF